MKKNEKKLRFSIRKLAVGAASVAIGATLLGVASQNQEVQAADTTATTSTTSSQDSLKIENMTVHMTDAEFAKINDDGFFNENSTNAQIVTDFAKQVQTANPGYEVTAEAEQGEVIVKKDGTTVKTIKVAEYLVNAGTLATTTKFVTPNTSDELFVPVKVKSLTSLTTSEFSQVEKLIKSLNSNVESVTQSGTKAIIKFTDGSTKNLSNKTLVNEGWISTFNRTGSLNTSATTVRLSDEKVVVKDAKNLTDEEKAQVIESLENANSGLSDKATIKVSDDGYVRVTFNTTQGGFTWLQPSDVITTDTTTKVNGTVKVKTNTRLYTEAGKITKTTVKKNSSWKTTSKKIMNGKTYYRIDSNKMWIPASRVTFTATKTAATVKVTYKSAKNTVTIKDGITKVSLYDHNLKKVTTTKSGSTFYTTMVRMENGKIVAYRYKTNQWIKVSDIAKVAAGKTSTTSTTKTTYPAYAATVVLKDDAKKKVSLYDYKLSKVTATLSNV
ncbi:YSIRK-type signal peptide-containing protein, partial [Lactobacillus sp.]